MGQSKMLKCPRCKEVKQKTHMVLHYDNNPKNHGSGLNSALMYCKHCYKAITPP